MPLELADAIAPPEGPDKDYLWTLNFGPQHPATHTTLRLILKLDGETVVKAMPDIGYLHSGFEKLGEHLDFNQYVTIVDRMNYISPVANEVAWHHAVEKLLGIELTPRCKYIRMIIAELMRIQRPPALQRGGGARPGRLHRVPVRLQPEGADLRHLRRDVGLALPSQLHARRRPAARLRRRLRSPWSAPSSRSFPRSTPTWCRLLIRNRIFLDRTQRHRRPDQGRRDRLQLHRPDRPRQRRRPRPAQGRAVPRLPRPRFQGRLRRRTATAGPLPRPHGGDAAEHQDHPAGDREPAGRRRSTWTSTARWCCPTSCRSTAASRA